MIGNQHVAGNADDQTAVAPLRHVVGNADAVAKAMQGAGNLDQLQEVAKGLAPMGQIGLKLFQDFMQAGTSAKKKDGG